MGFAPLSDTRQRAAKPPVTVRQRKSGIADVSVGAEVSARMGFPTDGSHKATLTVMIGTDEHRGLIQVRPAQPNEAPVRQVTVNKGTFTIRLKPRDITPEIVTPEGVKAQGVAFLVEGGTLTFELPEPIYTVAETAKAYMAAHAAS